MRKKSEERRDAILTAAAQEFSERGYEGASVSALSTRIGGSKLTLYSYFSSKAELFVEVMARAIDRMMDGAYAQLMDGGDNIVQKLRDYGEHYLSFRQSPEMVALVRLAFGEAGRSDIGRLMWERAKMKGIAKIAEGLAAAMEAGKLRSADPRLAAFHLFALFDAELVDAVILRVRTPASTDEISQIVARAVDVFVSAYCRPANS
jgi:AcrR family transcriptional regulator